MGRVSTIGNNDPYPCPKCGDAFSWVAEYTASVRQRVLLTHDPESGSITDTYEDPAEIVEEQDVEQFRCRSCDYVLAV